MFNLLNKWFHLDENGTTPIKELVAGLTTFAAMAYIIVVNPATLTGFGEPGAMFIATIMASALSTALLGLIDENVNVKGYDSADRVVGKGAAFLYIILGVARVHACVISRCALNTLGQSGIEVTYDILVDRIENRDKTGFCPIEEAVLSIDTPSLALIAIKNRLKELKS